MDGVRVKHAADVRDKLIKQLLDQQITKARLVVKDTAKRAETDLKQTLAYSGQSDEDGFRGATVRHKIERIVRTNKGIQITVRIWVADAQGNPHKVWHILQFGRESFIQRKTSPAIKERVFTPRTSPNKLQAGAFKGYTGDTFRIQAGTEVAALPARKWYEITRDNRQKEVPDRWEGWEIGNSDIVKP